MAIVTLKNPKSPPGKWLRECVKSAKSPTVDGPSALCGWVWYHRMKPTTKQKILKKYENPPYGRTEIVETPSGYEIYATDLATGNRSLIAVPKTWKEANAFARIFSEKQWKDRAKISYFAAPGKGAMKMNSPKPKSKKRVAAGKARTKPYVGVKNGKYKVFKSFYTPTRKSHGSRYTYVIGPFDTMRGAKYMADYGRGNPHLQTVADAERLAKRKDK